MGAAKPTLGFASRTAAVLALRAQGLSRAAIAARIGVAERTIAALEASARRTRALVAEGGGTVLLSPALMDALARAARARGTSAAKLARRIIGTVLDEGLLGAVLDDGAPSANEESNLAAKPESNLAAKTELRP